MVSPFIRIKSPAFSRSLVCGIDRIGIVAVFEEHFGIMNQQFTIGLYFNIMKYAGSSLVSTMIGANYILIVDDKVVKASAN